METPLPMGGSTSWWVVGLMGKSYVKSQNQINLDLIEIIQFCLKIYDLLRHHHLWLGVWWMYGLMGSSCQITSN